VLCDDVGSNDEEQVEDSEKDLTDELWNVCAVVSTKCYRAFNLNAQFMALYDNETLRAEIKVLYTLLAQKMIIFKYMLVEVCKTW